jgi:hypothetical protein
MPQGQIHDFHGFRSLTAKEKTNRDMKSIGSR